MARISLEQVNITYPIVHTSGRSLQLKIYQALGGELRQHQKAMFVHALRGIDLELRDGDRIGLIGENGAGKTTLLRVLAGIYPPSQGRATFEGRISSFTDITLGMDPEATGWENIRFRCAFMGLTFAQAKALTPSIAAFSELGDYLNFPIHIYSTGMFLRLAFAISTCVQPDILIMDEMISAGDKKFIDKAKGRIHELIKTANILALATHDITIMREICNKALWLDRGQIREVGTTEEVIRDYLKVASKLQ